MIEFKNRDEEELWALFIASYTHNNSVAKGAHLKFADNTLLALRKRQGATVVVLGSAARRHIPHGLSEAAFAKMIAAALDSHPSIIPRIKYLRERADLVLKAAKEIIEEATGETI